VRGKRNVKKRENEKGKLRKSLVKTDNSSRGMASRHDFSNWSEREKDQGGTLEKRGKERMTSVAPSLSILGLKKKKASS